MSTTQLGGLAGGAVGGPLLQNGSPQVSFLRARQHSVISYNYQMDPRDP